MKPFMLFVLFFILIFGSSVSAQEKNIARSFSVVVLKKGDSDAVVDLAGKIESLLLHSGFRLIVDTMAIADLEAVLDSLRANLVQEGLKITSVKEFLSGQSAGVVILPKTINVIVSEEKIKIYSQVGKELCSLAISKFSNLPEAIRKNFTAEKSYFYLIDPDQKRIDLRIGRPDQKILQKFEQKGRIGSVFCFVKKTGARGTIVAGAFVFFVLVSLGLWLFIKRKKK